MKQLPPFSRLYKMMMTMRQVDCSFNRYTNSVADSDVISVQTTTLYDNSQYVLRIELSKDKRDHVTVFFTVQNPKTNMTYDSGFCDDLNQEEMTRVKDFTTHAITKFVNKF